MGYSEEENQFVRDNWEQMTLAEMASFMDKTIGAIRNKRWRMGLVSRDKYWTSEEIEMLRDLYTNHDVLDLPAFEKLTGHPQGNISRKAKELGLGTSMSRRRKRKPLNELNKQYRQKLEHEKRTPKEQKQYISQIRKDAIKKHGHPRGSRSIRTCPSCGKFFDIENSSPTTHCSYECALKDIKRSQNTYTRGKGGKRPDLNNQYFRSRWEANYARYLNFLIKNNGGVERWEYEVDTFWFEKIRRGVRSYTPDFKVWVDGKEFEYHEVKGWDYPRGKTARKRMNKYYPTVKLILIGEDFFKTLRRQGIDALIEGWE